MIHPHRCHSGDVNLIYFSHCLVTKFKAEVDYFALSLRRLSDSQNLLDFSTFRTVLASFD